MSYIQNAESDLTQSIDHLRASINAISKSHSKDRLRAIASSDEAYNKVMKAVESCVNEIRSLPQDQKSDWRRRIAAYKVSVDGLKRTLDLKRNEVPESNIYDVGRFFFNLLLLFLVDTIQSRPVEKFDQHMLAPEQMIHEGDRVVGLIDDAISRMNDDLDEAHEMADDIARQLAEQSARLGDVVRDLDDMNAIMKQSAKTLGHISKEISSDTCVRVMAILIFCVMVGLIVVIITKTGLTTNSTPKVKMT